MALVTILLRKRRPGMGKPRSHRDQGVSQGRINALVVGIGVFMNIKEIAFINNFFDATCDVGDKHFLVACIKGISANSEMGDGLAVLYGIFNRNGNGLFGIG